jgi:uncharacterized protein involved in cysteine biosynthesis
MEEALHIATFVLAGIAGALSAVFVGSLVEILRAWSDPERRQNIRSHTLKQNLRRALS